MRSAAAVAFALCAAAACTDRPARAPASLPPARVSPPAAGIEPAPYEPHPSVEVIASPFAESMIARDRATGTTVRDLLPALAARGFADRNRYSLDFASVDAIGLAIRRPHVGVEPDALLAVDGATGQILWEREVPEPSRGGRLIAGARPPGGAPLVLVAGIISEQVAREGGAVGWATPIHALDARTGEVRFRARLDPGGDVRLAAVAGGVVVAASRCSWLAQFDCEGTLLGLDAGTGEKRWSRGIPKGSREIAFGSGGDELALAVDGRVEVLDARTGERHGGFARERTPSRILILESGLVLGGAGGLEAVARDGAALWRRADDVSVLGADGGRIVLATAFTEEVIDAATGGRLCHRNRAGGLPGAWAGAPPPGAAARAICDWPARPFSAGIRGALVVDGRPRPRARVTVQGLEVATGPDGSFAAAVDAPGAILVEPVWPDLARDPKRPCVSFEPALLTVDDPGRTYDVALEATTRPRACADACDPIDCE